MFRFDGTVFTKQLKIIRFFATSLPSPNDTAMRPKRQANKQQEIEAPDEDTDDTDDTDDATPHI